MPVLELPTDRPRPRVRTHARRTATTTCCPPSSLAQRQEAGASSARSLFATLLAGFAALLHRLTGQDDLVVGIPAAGQAAAGLEGLVGHCVNMLPLRVAVRRRDAVRAICVKAAARRMLDAYDHQDVTFGRVLQVLPIARDPSRLPLISVMFNIDQALTGERHSSARPALGSWPAIARRFETFELFVNAVDVARPACGSSASTTATCSTPRRCARWLAAYELLLRERRRRSARSARRAGAADATKTAARSTRVERDRARTTRATRASRS